MSEHLLVFPDREVADEVAEELSGEGFSEVRVVREALAGEDDAEDHEWAVYVREENVVDESRPVAQGLRDRFEALTGSTAAGTTPTPDRAPERRSGEPDADRPSRHPPVGQGVERNTLNFGRVAPEEPRPSASSEESPAWS